MDLARIAALGGSQRLPAALRFHAPRLAVVAFSIPVFWLAWGAWGGALWAVSLAVVIPSFIPRAIVLDDEGFQQVSLVPRRKVRWSDVDAFSTAMGAVRGGTRRVVRYTKADRTPRCWYLSGWPAHGTVEPAFALTRGERPLSADDLCGLLATRLALARGARARAEQAG